MQVAESVSLCSGDADWSTCATTTRALLFGQMIKRALPVIQAYHSDLFHDALWVQENVNGPTEFFWLIRQSGTNIEESAHTAMKIGPGAGAMFYRVTLSEARTRWSATFTHIADPDDVA